jgi:hypothetical protein
MSTPCQQKKGSWLESRLIVLDLPMQPFVGLERNIALCTVGQKRGCDNRLMSSDKLAI